MKPLAQLINTYFTEKNVIISSNIVQNDSVITLFPENHNDRIVIKKNEYETNIFRLIYKPINSLSKDLKKQLDWYLTVPAYEKNLEFLKAYNERFLTDFEKEYYQSDKIVGFLDLNQITTFKVFYETDHKGLKYHSSVILNDQITIRLQ